MKGQKVGKFNINTTREHNVYNSAKSCLISLDRFLVYLAEHKADIFAGFIKKLKLKYESEIRTSNTIFSSFDLDSVKLELRKLQENPDLIKTCFDLHISLLNLPRGYAWEPREVKLLHIDIDKANLVPRYYCARLLTELIAREEAIQFFKDYTDFYARAYREAPNYENLTAVYEDDIKRGKETESSIYTSALIHKGKYVSKCEKCMGHEALKDLNDPELTEIITCYGDFTFIKKINEHFVLTRNFTLHTGPYCDFCVHDTRIVKEIEHPPKEFFDNLDKNL